MSEEFYCAPSMKHNQLSNLGLSLGCCFERCNAHGWNQQLHISEPSKQTDKTFFGATDCKRLKGSNAQKGSKSSQKRQSGM